MTEEPYTIRQLKKVGRYLVFERVGGCIGAIVKVNNTEKPFACYVHCQNLGYFESVERAASRIYAETRQ